MTLLTLAQNQAWGFGPAPMLVLQRYPLMGAQKGIVFPRLLARNSARTVSSRMPTSAFAIEGRSTT
jgi:hypothetical protein